MRMTRMALLLVLALSLAPAAVFACEGDGTCECSPAEGAKKIAEAGALAEMAEAGCEKSTAKLIAMAKDSGNDKAIELAKNAEGGCEHSKAALIAMAKEMQADTKVAGYTKEMTQLAGYAGNGCNKSVAKLIAMAKKSKDKKTAELAAKADGGCEHSKAALIAMVQDTKKTEATK